MAETSGREGNGVRRRWKTGQMETQGSSRSLGSDASLIIHLFHRGLLNTYYVPYNGQKTDMLSVSMELTNQQNVK